VAEAAGLALLVPQDGLLELGLDLGPALGGLVFLVHRCLPLLGSGNCHRTRAIAQACWQTIRTA
jgi:hypothetical protein